VKDDILKDDPLGTLMGGKGKKDVAIVEETPEDDGGLGAAQALIDAIHAKDAAGVADAFSALNLTMKPPGEDDMEMSPSSASGPMLGAEE
jgi:hypothetical protein